MTANSFILSFVSGPLVEIICCECEMTWVKEEEVESERERGEERG